MKFQFISRCFLEETLSLPCAIIAVESRAGIIEPSIALWISLPSKGPISVECKQISGSVLQTDFSQQTVFPFILVTETQQSHAHSHFDSPLMLYVTLSITTKLSFTTVSICCYGKTQICSMLRGLSSFPFSN